MTKEAKTPEQEVLEYNVANLRAAFEEEGISAIDFAYRYRASNDEGYGRFSASHLLDRSGQRLDKDAMGKLKTIEVELKVLQQKFVENAWRTVEEVKRLPLMKAINACFDENFISDDFMTSNGSSYTESEGDDEGGSISSTITEGVVRFNLASERLDALDFNGQVVRREQFQVYRYRG